MPFSFHPPTQRPCSVCEELMRMDTAQPVVDTHNGKASSANNFPFHNWYNFVLGYSPQFPEYMLDSEWLPQNAVVMDPFMGTGTSLIACKMRGIVSQGIDANNFMVDAARTKLTWDLDTWVLKQYRDQIAQHAEDCFSRYDWGYTPQHHQLTLFDMPAADQDYQLYVQARRQAMLLEKYISNRPLARAFIIDDAIRLLVPPGPERDLFALALTAIIVPISNVRYGPGFGMVKPREDAPVLELFFAKVSRMLQDLDCTNEQQRNTLAEVRLGDSRELTHYFPPNSVDLMLTSPPYPGDHEYTKHTRLELTFREYATTHEQFRLIKQRMIRASTTNIYRDDRDREAVADIESIQEATRMIQERLDEDGATSGFEKLYTKLVWEYFGGMSKALSQCLQVLRPGGKIALLVSDSHAFKMVHIQTAAILQEIGVRVGFEHPEVVLWQFKPTTSHKYSLRENILMLSKPNH